MNTQNWSPAFFTSAVWVIALSVSSPAVLWGWQDDVPDSPVSLSGYSPSQAYEIDDREPVGPNDEFLIGLLYRVGKVSNQSLERFKAFSGDVPLSNVREDPRKYRFWVREVTGVVSSVRKRFLRNAGSGLKGYFEVEIESANGPAKIMTRRVPDSWLDQDAEGEPVSAIGFFLKFELDQGQELPVFVADHLAWFPNHPRENLGSNESQVVLARAGFDVGLLDLVRSQNKRYLGDADSEAFFELLAASARVSRAEMPSRLHGFVDLIKNSVRHFGDAVLIQGRVRRCVPIEIDSAFVRQETGLDHYFELDMFYSLDGQHIVLSGKGEEPLEYRHRFPVTVCVSDLPDGVSHTELEGQLVRIEGFFFRFWNYQAEFTGAQRGQISPLVIGLPPIVIEPDGGLLDSILMYGLLAVLLGAGSLIWFYHRADQGDRQRNRKDELPEQMDLEGVESD